MKIYLIILFIFILYLLYFFFTKYSYKKELFDEVKTNKQINKIIEIIDRLAIKRINKIPVYYINMDKDVDRREYMESQLPNHFEQYHRIPGFNGKKIKDKYHDTIDGVEFYNEFENSLSEIGCTLSHLLAIKTAYENEDEIACIMEDDVYMNLLNINDESLDEIVKNIHIEWEILKLFHLDSTKLNKEFIPIKKHNFHLFNDNSNTFSTVCYLINRKGMEKILSIMGHNPFYLMKYMGNTCTADYILYNQVKTYDIEPSLVTINNTELDSTIHNDHTSNHIEMSLKKLEKYKEDILSKCCSFLNIIIYNENKNYERLMKKEIETYLKKFKNVIHYFVTYRDQNDYIIIEDNCIYIKGKEGLIPQCLDKTIIAIDYCINQLNIQFDFLVRSNISTIINFNQFPIELPLTNCYTSAFILPIKSIKIDIPYGINKNNINKLRGLQYASGINIIMSKDVVKYLVDHKYELDRTLIDDISIGFLLSKHFKPIQIKQEKKMIINEFDKDAFVIRNKSNNRYDDVSRMMKLNNYENQKNQSSLIISANFGNIDSNYLIDNMVIYDESSLFPHPNLSPRLRAKYFRMCTHLLYPNTSFYIWSDASIILKEGIIDWLIYRLGDFDALFFKHSKRSSITEEKDFLLNNLNDPYLKQRYEGYNMSEQVKDYLDDGFNDQIGLMECGLFIRRNKPNVNNAFNEWFIEQVKWSIQDQLSLPYILWKHQINFKLIEDYTVYEGPFHKYKGHRLFN